MKLTLEQIKAKAIRDVEIPGWEEGETITVTVKPVSIFGLASQGKIPNALLNTAIELFEGKKSAGKKADGESTDITLLAKIVDVLCAETLVEPAYEDVKEYLTDEQRNAIFSLTQSGAKKLEGFRKK